MCGAVERADKKGFLRLWKLAGIIKVHAMLWPFVSVKFLPTNLLNWF